MTLHYSRRGLLLAAAAAAAARPLSSFAQARSFAPRAGAWRQFEVTTTVEVADAQGPTRIWLPVPGLETDFQTSLGNTWSGNAAQARLEADPRTGTRMLCAEFDPAIARPTLTLSSRVKTRNRAVDWQRPAAGAEDPAVLAEALRPTELIPLDGIVRRTALQATRGASTDLARVKAIYAWVVHHAHREPKVRGCGNGDIETLLETGDLGGKCADLNAVFVGLCRASGVPARDIYGLRVAPSEFNYRELGAKPANLSGAQHCRAEVHLKGYGWVAMDPADVLKVMRQETPHWITDPQDPLVAPVSAALFGAWESNWVGWNRGQDVRLPGSRAKGTLPFLMYPNGENASGRFDELSPDTFRYAISAREIAI